FLLAVHYKPRAQNGGSRVFIWRMPTEDGRAAAFQPHSFDTLSSAYYPPTPEGAPNQYSGGEYRVHACSSQRRRHRCGGSGSVGELQRIPASACRDSRTSGPPVRRAEQYPKHGSRITTGGGRVPVWPRS